VPLLNVCGITGNNKVIQVGLSLLSSETEADYNWAKQKIWGIIVQEIIREPTDTEITLIRCLNTQLPASPHILCRWHANMNVLAQTKKFSLTPVRVNNCHGVVTNTLV
jgi:hypothetical protein